MSFKAVVPAPRSWAHAELREIVEVTYGKALPERERDATGSYPVVGSSGVVGRHTCAVVDGPCLVVGRKGAAGSVHYINRSCWPIDTAYFIQPPTDIDITFLRHFLASEQLVQLEKSTAVPSLSRDDLYDVRVPLPPLREQVRIGAMVEEFFSDLDAAVGELEAAQKKLTQYRQSLLKAAVEGDLTVEWRASNPPQETGAELLARILRERRARWEVRQLERFRRQARVAPNDWQTAYPEAAPADHAALPRLPDGWTWATVEQLSPDDLANGRSVPTADQGAKVLRLTAVRRGYIDLDEYKHGAWTAEEAEPFYVQQDDLLIVRGNGSLSLVGRAGLVPRVAEPVAYPDTLIRLRTLGTIVRPAWLAAAWDSARTRGHMEKRARTSAGIYKISQPDIVSVTVAVPPLAEQDEALARLALSIEQLDAMEVAIEQCLKMATAQRQNILLAAFSGQLVPQDPKDEPASVLLARIRAERNAAAPAGTARSRANKPKARAVS